MNAPQYVSLAQSQIRTLQHATQVRMLRRALEKHSDTSKSKVQQGYGVVLDLFQLHQLLLKW
jgi:hypothetical protein